MSGKSFDRINLALVLFLGLLIGYLYWSCTCFIRAHDIVSAQTRDDLNQLVMRDR